MDAIRPDAARAPETRARYAPRPTVVDDAEAFIADLLRQSLHLIRKHWMWIALVMAVCGGLGVAYTLVATPVYRATGVIQVEPEEAKIVGVNEVVGANRTVETREFYQTQYGLLRSRTLAESVVQALGPDVVDPPGRKGALGRLREMVGLGGPRGPAATPEARTFAAANAVLQRVQISPVPNSRLIRISYDDPDPRLAARVVDTYADRYIASNLSRRYEASAYARDFLETRINQLRGKLEATERELVSYATEANLVGQGGGEAQSAAATALNALTASLAEATNARIKAEQRWKSVQSAGQAGVAEALTNETLRTLRAERARVWADYQDKLQVYGPDFPAMRQQRARIAEFDAQVGAEEARISTVIRQEMRAAAAAEQQLKAEIETLRAQSLDTDRRAINYNILKRELDTNKTLYDGLLQRYREIGIAGGVGANNVAVVDRASVPAKPQRPVPLLNIAVALLIGAGLAALLVWMLEYWDQNLRRPEDVERKLGLPTVGCIPLFAGASNLIDELDNPRAVATEAYHSARAGIQFARELGLPKSLLVTSSQAGEGKSTTAVSLATVFARTGAKVLLVDGDLRDPSVHKMLTMRNRVGFSNVLERTVALTEAVQASSRQPRLDVLTAGPLPSSPADLLGGSALRAALSEAERAYDLVVIDGPPVMGLADAPSMATEVEATLFVVSANRVSRVVAKRAIARLQASRADILGGILTRFDSARESYGGYGYEQAYGQYSYGYGLESAAQDAPSTPRVVRSAQDA